MNPTVRTYIKYSAEAKRNQLRLHNPPKKIPFHRINSANSTLSSAAIAKTTSPPPTELHYQASPSQFFIAHYSSFHKQAHNQPRISNSCCIQTKLLQNRPLDTCIVTYSLTEKTKNSRLLFPLEMFSQRLYGQLFPHLTLFPVSPPKLQQQRDGYPTNQNSSVGKQLRQHPCE